MALAIDVQNATMQFELNPMRHSTLKTWVTKAIELYPDANFSNKVNHIINSL